MSVCPQCRRSYESGTTKFCIDDGTVLVEEGGSALSETGAATNPAAGQHHHHPSPLVTNMEFPPRVNPVDEGAQVGEYVVGKKIGEGGMGVIYAGLHPIIGKKVALKVLNTDMASNPDIVGRFIQEAKSVNQIGHRNIVDIFSFGRLADGRHYFAMEFLEGQSLASRLAAEIPMQWSEAIQVWLQIASAIDAAHQKGIIHRDLKPDNVFVTPSPDGPFVKVLDFGIAKLLGDTPGLSKTSTGVPIGTPAYMSPEQARGGVVDLRTDLYAFGIILYETISGRPPFLHHQTFIALLTAHLSEPPPPLVNYIDVHPELNNLVDRLLSKDPNERPKDMAEVRVELVRLRDLAIQERRPLYAAKGELGTATLNLPEPSTHEDALTTVRKAVPAPQGRSRAAGVALVGIVVAVAVGGGLALKAMRHETPTVVAPPLEAPHGVVAAAAIPSPSSMPPNTGRVVISTNAIATKVYLDKSDKERSAQPAAAGGMNLKVAVPAGVDWVLRVEADGFKSVSLPIRIGAGEESSLPVVMVPDAPKQVPHVGGGGGGRPKPPPGTAAVPAQPEKHPSGGESGTFINPF